MKKTALYEAHLALGGQMVEFNGWVLPMQYESILAEHKGVREAAGLFDVSHMGEISVRGQDAEAFLQALLTNDLSTMKDNQVLYSPMCNPEGRTLDDLLVYRLSAEEYFVVGNAANTERNWAHFKAHSFGNLQLENITDEVGLIALQGPRAQEILAGLTKKDLSALVFYRFDPEVEIAGVKALVSRTGYTGEDGFELYVNNRDAAQIWQALLEYGKDKGLVPAGLGARDTLRFEAALPLYGHELTESISPIEAGLGFFVKTDKPQDFIGKEALTKERAQGPSRRLAGLEMLGRGIPRQGYQVAKDGLTVGFITSGSFSPSTGKNFALALVDAKEIEIGNQLDVLIRERPVAAQVVRRPFVDKKYKK